MKEFAVDYGFEHVTSSPKYPTSLARKNALKQLKTCLKKARDPYHALLDYRATPLSIGYSPAQLLMGCHLPTILSILPERLQPALPDLQSLQHKERAKRWMDAKCFNKRHRARYLAKLSPVDHVWISDAKAQGTVTSIHHSLWSYLVSGQQGTLTRNCHHLVPIPAPESQGQYQQEYLPEVDTSAEQVLRLSPTTKLQAHLVS
ncbi:hypothetical protein LDENG_00078990 [Lucifuga dentata]|nr:hypothetical protein LDENG_00078990 [Lucifuga dentata]